MQAPPEHDEGRPPAKERPRNVVATDIHRVPEDDTAQRCTRCQHPIRAEESVRVGMGPVCRREVAA